MIMQTNPVLERIYELVTKIGGREHVVYHGKEREPDYVRVRGIRIPGMNGEPLPAEQLANIHALEYMGKIRRAQTKKDGIRIHVKGRVVVVPFCAIEDAHDFTHLAHCVESGAYPFPDSMQNLLNREAVEEIYAGSEASRLSRFQSA